MICCAPGVYRTRTGHLVVRGVSSLVTIGLDAGELYNLAKALTGTAGLVMLTVKVTSAGTVRAPIGVQAKDAAPGAFGVLMPAVAERES